MSGSKCPGRLAIPTVEFGDQGTTLLLIYRPDIGNPEHQPSDFSKGKYVTIKGTYHLAEPQLFKSRIPLDRECSHTLPLAVGW